MTKPNTQGDTEGLATWEVPKTRDCLRCGTSFESRWSGERICPHCKSSNSWRNGLPLNTRTAAKQRQR